MKSIMQTEKKCYMCHATYGLEEHHIFNSANRRLSERYGLKVWLCVDHHRGSKAGVHFNREFSDFLKAEGQRKFEEQYPDLSFKDIFGKNYK